MQAPEGNGCAERVIRALKEQLLWVKSFATFEELRLALIAWAEIYNREWMLERHGFRSRTRALRPQRRETGSVSVLVTILTATRPRFARSSHAAGLTSPCSASRHPNPSTGQIVVCYRIHEAS